MKVKRIKINHPDHGEIEINASIRDDVSEMIGDTVNDYSKIPCFYYAKIVVNNDATFSISDLMVIKPASVNVGFMINSKGIKNYITVIKNIEAGDDITIYPSGIISVTYN